jgi:tetratricopeptide (TPR) repeat protein
MPLFEELGDEYGQAFVHGNRGRLLFSQSRNDQAIACFERSLPVFRDRGARIWEARTLDWLGRTLAANGQASQAGVAWQRALEIFQDLGVPEVLDIAARLEG